MGAIQTSPHAARLGVMLFGLPKLLGTFKTRSGCQTTIATN